MNFHDLQPPVLLQPLAIWLLPLTRTDNALEKVTTDLPNANCGGPLSDVTRT